MKPRTPTEEDFELWGDGCTIGPMRGDHIGAGNIEVIRQADKIHVPWVFDERDEHANLLDGITVWTTFWGGMLATDVVVQ